MSDLQERIAGLSPQKRELLNRLLREKGVATSRLPITSRNNTSGQMPLSFAQQRLWFLDQLEPGSSFYNIFDTLAFNEPLDVSALEQSLNEIVRRHEVLRTTFKTVEGQAVQVIAPSLSLPLAVVDLTKLSPLERDAEASRLSTEEARRPFDLSQGPMIRAKLLRLEEEEHVLLLTMHHIISDGWSLEILNRELKTLYEAFAAGEESPLAELPIQYGDFAVWQRDWMRGAVLDEQLSYWKKQLTGAPSALELPTDHLRPLVPSHLGATQSRILSQKVAESLRDLSRREGVTLFMTLLSAFNILLSRYTHQDDIVVGSPIAGRNRAETEDLIGFFVNTLVMRTDLSGDPSFRELLERVREVALGAYAHQDLPFEKLVEVIQPERDTSRNPLFQVSFQLTSVSNSADEAAAEFGELTDESQPEVERGTAKFDLEVNVWESKSGLKVQVTYSTDLFEDATVTRLLKHFERLLEGIVSDPTSRVSRLPLLTADEEQQMLFKWNETESDYPRDSCLHELFEAQSERTPDAIAVISGNERLTYAELNERANQLAHRLERLGVSAEVTVGICMERSIEMLTGMLGILKAGGSYVPLDPEYPAQRLSFMIQDAGVRVLLTEKRLAKDLRDHDASILCLDTDWESIAEESKDNLGQRVWAENTAYVIYTSGSTGTPKGVSILHSAVGRTICNTSYIKLESQDRVAQASNSSFDAATFEIWGTLLHGATLIIFPKEVLISPKDLAAQIRELELSVMFLPTALFNQVAAEVSTAFSSLRYLLFGGEAVDHRWVREVLKNSPPQVLLHMYGPTESTTYASWHRIDALSADASTVPIGRPLSNTQIYLLDKYLQPVPIGVSGELYIGGDGLARGYLHRPQLTAEKFIPNHFSHQAGERLYRTGDLARFLENGEIEFLGRGDEQVKVRGYRIELGEIEALLREHAQVLEVVALAREDAPGEKRLAAYVVAEKEGTLSASELRSYMKERAPEYMIPSSFVLMEQLPLTANGKVDRRALPLPALAMQEQRDAFVSPGTSVEIALAGIYGSVLKVERVGINDNFFDLGGHSLLATQIVSRIRESFKVELPLRTLFADPTVAGLASALEEALKNNSQLHAPAIGRVSREQYRATISAAGTLEVPAALKSSMRALKD